MIGLLEAMALHLLALGMLALTRRGRAPGLGEDALLYMVGLTPVLIFPMLALAGRIAPGPGWAAAYLFGLLITAILGLGAALTVESAPRTR